MKAFSICIFLLLLTGCSDNESGSPAPPVINDLESPLFEDAAEITGLKFTYDTGSAGERFLAEIVGGGAALFDCDSDGDLDVLFTQGHTLDSIQSTQEAMSRLFRNDLDQTQGEPVQSFRDITSSSGLEPTPYGMGVATGDVDNDGDVDIYLTSFTENSLWMNQGACVFEEAEGQLVDSRWSVSASFFDSQADGWLDLFVGNYLDHSIYNNRQCRNLAGVIDYCGPKAYRPVPNSLWVNLGEGRFEDHSMQSGIDKDFGGALGVVASDFNADGIIDLYVANDQRPNLLWLSTEDGSLINDALLNGCAVNSSGLAEASMGVDLGDVNLDGHLDLFMTHLRQESNTLYEVRDGQCMDRSNARELAAPSMPFTGFGTGFLDFDHDGDLDIFVANGEIEIIMEQMRAGEPFPLKQSNQLFENIDGQFIDASMRGGTAVTDPYVSRGAAFGDIDNDGDTDIVVVNSNDPVQLLINTVGQDRNWIGFEVRLSDSGRYAIGAELSLMLPDGSTRMERVSRDGSYASSNDPRVVFGLGDVDRIDRVTVRWPDGQKSTYSELLSGQYHVLFSNQASSHD